MQAIIEAKTRPIRGESVGYVAEASGAIGDLMAVFHAGVRCYFRMTDTSCKAVASGNWPVATEGCERWSRRHRFDGTDPFIKDEWTEWT